MGAFKAHGGYVAVIMPQHGNLLLPQHIYPVKGKRRQGDYYVSVSACLSWKQIPCRKRQGAGSQ
jgi:hypothetical protein